MKKLLLGAVLLASVGLQARIIQVTSSCGTITRLEISDDATLAMVTQAVSNYNMQACGTKPKSIQFNISL